MAEPLEARVAAALARIQNPRLENDLLSAGMIRDLAVSSDGAVSFTFLLAPEDPATLVRQARGAVQEVEGVRRDAIVTSTRDRRSRERRGSGNRTPQAIPRRRPRKAWRSC